jgi:hypothetical protein
MNRCPVCGYDGLDEPAFDDDGVPSFDICDCCGTQFGYDDATMPHSVLREKWVAKGMPWHSRVIPPPLDWDPVEQSRWLTTSDETDSGRKTKQL